MFNRFFLLCCLFIISRSLSFCKPASHSSVLVLSKATYLAWPSYSSKTFVKLHSRTFETARSRFCVLQLLLAFDVELNPGPPAKHPCRICSRAVKRNDKAVCCDQCNYWVHNHCSGLSSFTYESLKTSDAVWVCPSCGFPSFSSSFFDSSSELSVSNRFSSLVSQSGSAINTPESSPMTSTPINCRTSSATNKPKLHSNNVPLKCISINVNGLRSKTIDINELLASEDVDVLFCQETKIDSSVLSSEVFPSNFSVFRKDRDSHGGGVCIAINRRIKVTEYQELSNNSESIWLRLHTQPVTYLCSFYKPPDKGSDYMELLRSSLNILLAKKTKSPPRLFIAGDFNFGKINWTNMSAPSVAEGRGFLDILNDFHLQQLVEQPTRCSKNSQSLLDLVISSHPALVSELYVGREFSDHCLISFMLNCAVPSSASKRTILCYNRADFNKIREDLSFFQLSYLNSCKNKSVDDNWFAIKAAIQDTSRRNIPIKTVSDNKKPKPQWINYKISKQINIRDRMARVSKTSPSQINRDRYKKQRNLVSNMVKGSYRDFLTQLIGNLGTNTRAFYRFIKSKKVDTLSIPPLTSNGVTCSKPSEQADCLNKQFASVFTQEDMFSIPFVANNFGRMSDITVSICGVVKLLEGLDVNKSLGPDDISPRVLKESASQLGPVLCSLFNQSLLSSTVPQDWRDANIFALHKKGPKSCPSNYRPISLTCIICKLLEHIIYSNISSFLESQNILTARQHGFRKNHSCETQLLLAHNDWASALDNGISTDVAIFDFSKAFDVVPHQRLLSKLNSCGINRQTISWINSFLQHRRQRVVIEGQHSSWVDVISGVPQGTVLGPLLFLIYINDISTVVNSEIRLFADDCILYRQIQSSTDVNILQEDINSLLRWANKWQMKFNVSKCCILPITRCKQPHSFTYKLGNDAISTVKSHQYLGVNISSDLRWNLHIQDIVAKASRTLNFVRRNLYCCPPDAKALAFKTLVRPQLEYASAVWDPYSNKNIASLESVQRRGARFAKNDYRQTTSVTQLLIDLDWCPLSVRRRNARLVQFYKAYNNNSPIDLSVLQRPSRHTRSSCDGFSLIVPQTSSDVYKYSFIPRTVVDWNSCALAARQSLSLDSFKSALFNSSCPSN